MGDESSEVDKLRILHLEDSPADAEIIRECLFSAGFSMRLDWASNEKEFETFLASGPYDLILADYRLPRFDAAAALSMVNVTRPGTPFIAVSGAIGEDRAVELLKEGATDYVLKDRLEKLPLSLRRALGEAREHRARRRAEDALRTSEARYRRIVDTAAEGIWAIGPDSVTTFVNARMAAMLGYRGEEMTGKSMTDFMFKEDWEDHLRKIDLCAQNSVESYERRFRRRDGEAIWTQVSATSNFDDEDRFLGSFAMYTDITDRKKTMENLSLMDFALNQVPDAVCLVDDAARFVYVNEETCRILGYSRRQLSEMRLSEIDPETPLRRWLESWDEIKAGRAMVFAGRHRSPNGRIFPVEIAASFFTYEGHGYSLAVLRDISDRDRAGEIKRLISMTGDISRELSKIVANYDDITTTPSLSDLNFSHRQIEIARLLLEGAPSKSIAMNLGVAETTIKSHIAQMYRKLNVNSRMEFGRIVAERGIRLE